MPASLALFQHALLFAFKTSVWLALVAAGAGVAISLVLSVFQIQDQTLPFAIRLVIVGAAITIMGPSIGTELVRVIGQAFELAGDRRI